jgi:transcriptional regulator with XRE-family HTH domain
MPARARDEEEKGLAAAIGQEIRRARLEKGWTQARLAEAMTMKRPAVARIESGGTLISVVTFFRFCRVLEISHVPLLDRIKESLLEGIE